MTEGAQNKTNLTIASLVADQSAKDALVKQINSTDCVEIISFRFVCGNLLFIGLRSDNRAPVTVTSRCVDCEPLKHDSAPL